MNKRSLARQFAMKSLFQIDLVKADLEDVLAYFREEESLSADVVELTRQLTDGAQAHREEIDNRIREHLRNWDFDRVGNVEKAILRLAVFELLHRPETPPKVAINEALELGKEYTTQKSVRFINGVLHEVARKVRPMGDDGAQATPTPTQKIGKARPRK